MATHDSFILKVTAGPSYDTSTHSPVAVNKSTALPINSSHLAASVHVRIRDYRGLPKNSPSSSPYFSHASHQSDRYSIAFAFTPETDIAGHDLVFGNDFEHPIRDRLPTGFSYALKIVQWTIDPGLEGDPYADKPYLYGPLLSSINVLRIGEKGQDETALEKKAAKNGGAEVVGHGEEEVVVVQEGAEGDGEKVRETLKIPEQAAARQKHFLNLENRKAFTFEKGRMYSCDFFNPYLDFNDFSLKLPGFTLNIIKHWDGQPLRYVLKNKATDDVLFVISFTLLPAEDAAEDTAEAAGEATGVKKGESEEVEKKGKEKVKDDYIYVDEDVD